MGRLEESIQFGLRMPHATLDCPTILAAALALVGDRTRASLYVQRFLADFHERVTFGRTSEPGEPLRWPLHVDPFRRAEDVERVTTGLRLAGLSMDPDTDRPHLVATLPVGSTPSVAAFRRDADRWHVAFEHIEHLCRRREGIARHRGTPVVSR